MSALFYLIVFFIAYKDMMKGNEKKNESPCFFFSLAAKFFDETMMMGYSSDNYSIIILLIETSESTHSFIRPAKIRAADNHQTQN